MSAHFPDEPHTSPSGDATTDCIDCGVTWPCPIRLAQRTVNREVVALLTSEGYKRVPLADDDPAHGGRWANAISCAVVLRYGALGLVATIYDPSGNAIAHSDTATVGFVDRWLP